MLIEFMLSNKNGFMLKESKKVKERVEMSKQAQPTFQAS